MNLAERWSQRARAFGAVSLAGCLAFVLFAHLAPDRAAADLAGELAGSWGVPGTGPGQLNNPGPFGIDASPGEEAVFIGDVAADSESVRVQKFSLDGELEGSVTLPTPAEPAFPGSAQMVRRKFNGIVVDPDLDRFYLLQYRPHADTEGSLGLSAAEQILVFSTDPNAEGELEAPAEGPSVLPVPSPTGSESLVEPKGFAVDPVTHDVVLLARERTSLDRLVAQRVVATGPNTGTLRPQLLTEDISFAQGSLAIGPDGTLYTMAGQANNNTTTAAYQLPPGGTFWQPVPGFVDARIAAEWKQGPNAAGHSEVVEGAPVAKGPQLAISPDGDILYWKGFVSGTSSTLLGYSFADRANRVVYGNGTGSCLIQGRTSAVAALGNETWVVDNAATGGPKVRRFGPGGAGCPASAATFALKDGADVVDQVSAGTAVTFDPAGTEVKSPATLEELSWQVEGPEVFAAPVATTTPVPFEHTFDLPGTYTVRLSMKTGGTAAGKRYGRIFAAEPRTLLVEAAPQHALNVTVDGQGTVTSTPPGIDCGADCSEDYDEGTAVTLTAAPDADWQFKEWTGACTGGGPCIVTMDAAKEVGAVFELQPPDVFDLVLVKSGSGDGAFECEVAPTPGFGPCAATYQEGTTIVVRAVPLHSSFVGWSGAGCSGGGTCTVTSIAADTTLTATFAQNPPVVTTDPEGTVTQTTAVLNGHVDNEGASGGSACSFQVALATDTAFVNPVATVDCAAPNNPVMGDTSTPVAATALGLIANTAYIYRVRASNSGSPSPVDGAAEAFSTLPNPPTVTTDPEGALTQTTAVLNGHVDNEGASGGSACSFQVALATDTAFANPVATVDCAAPNNPVMGDASTAVSATATGLTAKTNYIYRVRAENSGSSTPADGNPESFSTPPNAPTVVTAPGASEVTQSSARVGGTVNPNSGSVGKCEIEYGTSTAYDLKVPCASLPGSGVSPVPVTAVLSGLAANTTYHFRVVAANAGGTVNGPDQSFATLSHTCATDPALCPPPVDPGRPPTPTPSEPQPEPRPCKKGEVLKKGKCHPDAARQRRQAIAKCRKKRGRAKVRCLKAARKIGRPARASAQPSFLRFRLYF